MLAFDVPVAALPTKMLAEQDAGQAVGFAADLPFLGSPPIKVFQHVMENWTVHDSPIQYESCEAQVVEISPPVVKDMYHTPEVASVPDLNHLTAPKADDAQAHQEIWDNRVWRTQSCTPELRSRFTERYGKNPLDVIRVTWEALGGTTILRHRCGSQLPYSCRWCYMVGVGTGFNTHVLALAC